MTFRIGVGAFALVTAAGCLMPSLSELEQKSRSTCDSAHPCADGWTCGSDGLCAVKSTGGPCNEGDVMSCGITMGECIAGTATCHSAKFGTCMGSVDPVAEVCDGKDNDCDGPIDEDATDSPACGLQAGVCAGKRAPCGGTCTATTYGPDYEAVETKCDGKDNDCDTAVDVGLTSACSKQQGVCAGASVACSDGGFAACSDALYRSNNNDYEPYEKTCDGKDNDCDGKVDAWDPVNISNSGGLHSRSAVAAVAASFPADMVVLWEEEEPAPAVGTFKVRSRVVRADNTMGATIVPSMTVTGSARSFAPAIASDGAIIAAAWIEEITLGGQKRGEIALLDPATGASTLTGGGALQLLQPADLTQPTQVAVAVDFGASRALMAVIDGSSLSYVAVPLPLEGASPRYKKVGAVTGVQHVAVAPAGGSNFWLTYEVLATANVTRCLVDDLGNRACNTTAASPPNSRVASIAPLTSVAPFGATSVFLLDVDAGASRVYSASCADGGTCGAQNPVAAIPLRLGMDALKMTATARNAAPTFFTWDESMTSVRYVVTTRSDGGVQPFGGLPGRRPAPVFTGTNRGAIVFDTENIVGAGLTADDVFVARYCF